MSLFPRIQAIAEHGKMYNFEETANSIEKIQLRLSFSLRIRSIPLVMKSAILLSAFIPSALGATIYLAGDSTMAKGGTGSGTAGTCFP